MSNISFSVLTIILSHTSCFDVTHIDCDKTNFFRLLGMVQTLVLKVDLGKEKETSYKLFVFFS